MRKYKVYELSDYSQFSLLNDVLTDEQKNKRNRLWCFHNKKHFLDKITFECDRGDVDDACFNMYANMCITREIFTNTNIHPISLTPYMYTKIVNQNIYNRCYWYAIKIFENDKHIDTVCIMAIKDGNYYHTYGKSYDADGWPKSVPEEYKSQCVYKEMQTPYIPDELNDSNIELKNGKIYVEGKEITEHGYYANEVDMYELHYDYTNSKYILYIHTPFNVLDLNHIKSNIVYYINKFLNNLTIKIVGDNTQLSNVTNIRIGGVGICEEWLNLIDKEQQSNIIKHPSTYNVNLLYKWKTTTYNLNN